MKNQPPIKIVLLRRVLDQKNRLIEKDDCVYTVLVCQMVMIVDDLEYIAFLLSESTILKDRENVLERIRQKPVLRSKRIFYNA